MNKNEYVTMKGQTVKESLLFHCFMSNNVNCKTIIDSISYPIKSYMGLLEKETSRKSICAIFDLLSTQDNYPVYFDYKNKDEFDSLWFIILGALGVSLEDIKKEIDLTDKSKEMIDFFLKYKTKFVSLEDNIIDYLHDSGVSFAKIDEVKSIILKGEKIPEKLEYAEIINGKVNFSNSYLNEYNLSKIEKASVMKYADGFVNKSYQLPVKIGALNGKFSIAQKDNAKVKIESFTDKDNNVYVLNLKAGKEYIYSLDSNKTTSSFVTGENQNRFIKIDSLNNVRDIGGYKTLSGKKVKQGLMYRSCKLDYISQKGIDTLVNYLGVYNEFDFRDYQNVLDGNIIPSKELLSIPGFKYHNFPITDYDENLECDKYPRAIKALVDTFDAISNKDIYPIIYHCKIGVDRTGTFTYLLLAFLGVNEIDLLKEYSLSWFSNYREEDGMWDKRFESIYDFNEHMKSYKSKDLSLQENVRAYLLDIGIPSNALDKIEQIMLE